MKKKSLSRVGIDKDTSILRNKRVRYQSAIFEKYSEQSSSLCPLLNGGYTRNGQSCVPIKYTKLPLPESLVSHLREATEQCPAVAATTTSTPPPPPPTTTTTTSDAIVDVNEENESCDESCEEDNIEDTFDSDIDI